MMHGIRRQLSTALVIISLSAAGLTLPGGAKADETLFARLGDGPAVSAVVEQFTARILDDDRISTRYANTDIENWRGHLRDFVCSATGGGCEYSGRAMKSAHARMNISDDEFNWTAGHLVATLNDFNVPAKEHEELIAAIASLRDQVVGW